MKEECLQIQLYISDYKPSEKPSLAFQMKIHTPYSQLPLLLRKEIQGKQLNNSQKVMETKNIERRKEPK